MFKKIILLLMLIILLNACSSIMAGSVLGGVAGNTRIVTPVDNKTK